MGNARKKAKKSKKNNQEKSHDGRAQPLPIQPQQSMVPNIPCPDDRRAQPPPIQPQQSKGDEECEEVPPPRPFIWNQEPPPTVVAVESEEKRVKDRSRGKGEDTGTDAPRTASNPSHSRPMVAGTGQDGTKVSSLSNPSQPEESVDGSLDSRLSPTGVEAMILEQTMRLVKETLDLKDLVKALLSKKGTKQRQGSDLRRIAAQDLGTEGCCDPETGNANPEMLDRIKEGNDITVTALHESDLRRIARQDPGTEGRCDPETDNTNPEMLDRMKEGNDITVTASCEELLEDVGDRETDNTNPEMRDRIKEGNDITVMASGEELLEDVGEREAEGCSPTSTDVEDNPPSETFDGNQEVPKLKVYTRHHKLWKPDIPRTN